MYVSVLAHFPFASSDRNPTMASRTNFRRMCAEVLEEFPRIQLQGRTILSIRQYMLRDALGPTEMRAALIAFFRRVSGRVTSETVRAAFSPLGGNITAQEEVQLNVTVEENVQVAIIDLTGDATSNDEADDDYAADADFVDDDAVDSDEEDVLYPYANVVGWRYNDGVLEARIRWHETWENALNLAPDQRVAFQARQRNERIQRRN
jgi:hypothetical protein